MLVVFHALLAYGLSSLALCVVATLFALVGWWVGSRLALALALCFAATTLLLAAGVALLGIERRIYARPHEMLDAFDTDYGVHCYRRNADVVMESSFGDLVSLTRERIFPSRPLAFRTDDAGFRNDRDYHGQPWVALGDSFVVGISTTQEETLTAQLFRQHALDVYNLGCPGNPGDHEVYATNFAARVQGDPRFLLFLFEGNDFTDDLPGEISASRDRSFAKRYLRMFSTTGLYRVLYSLRRRFERRHEIDNSTDVTLAELPFGRMGFFVPYVKESERERIGPLPALEATLARMAPRLQAVFFVPTKYRVYQPLLHPGQTLPHAHWTWLEAFCREQKLACVDLTPALVHRSQELLASGGFTFWPDDTHWSPEGIAVAARAVRDALEGGGAPGGARVE